MTGISRMLEYNSIACRYDEIAIKGENRTDFERRLAGNIQRKLLPVGNVRIVRQRGRIFVYPPKGEETFSKEARDMLCERLAQVFGIASFSPAVKTAASLEELERVIRDTLPTVLPYYQQSRESGEKLRYAMRAHVKDSHFPMKAQDLEIHFADQLLEEYPFKVDLDHPELRIDVEIRGEDAFVAYERIAGPGGLPSGTAAPLVALLSGGIDSPVACYQAMKRGAPIRYVTFHSAPYTPEYTVTKVARLAAMLNEWQKPSPLIAINLLPAQKCIRDECNARLRTVLYRRMMMRIATLLARVCRAGGIVTGEALGQVASQTLENMAAISQCTDLPVLRPVVTFDKKETIAIADRIQTLEVSNEEAPDSCTVFAPDKPVTAAKADRVVVEEEKLDIAGLLRECLEKSSVINTETLEEGDLTELGDVYYFVDEVAAMK